MKLHNSDVFSTFLPSYYLSVLAGNMPVKFSAQYEEPVKVSLSLCIYSISTIVTFVVIFWGLYFISVVATIIYGDQREVISLYVNTLNDFIDFHLPVISSICTVSKSQKIFELLRKFHKFDSFNHIDSSFHHTALLRNLLLVFALVCLNIATTAGHIWHDNSLANLSMGWAYFSLNSTVCQFCEFTYLLKRRFKLLNERLLDLDGFRDLDYLDLLCIQRNALPNTKKLKVICHSFNYLCDLLESVNLYYQLQILIVLIISFMDSISAIYYGIFYCVKESPPFPLLVIWCSYTLIVLYSITSNSSSVVAEVSNVKLI